MTLEQLITRIRNLSRVDSNHTSDSVLMERIEDAIRMFSLDVHGFHKEENPILEATFDTNTDMRLNVTITGGTNALTATDVQITSTDREDASASTVASDLQTALNTAIATGDITVGFTNFYFTFDTTTSSVSTDITIASPDDEDYLDATEILGLNGSLDENSTTSGLFEGDFPTGCTRRVSLDREPLSIQAVYWDQILIDQAPKHYFRREDYSGDPQYYYQEGNELVLLPSPQEQKEFYVSYKAIAELDTYQGYQECGLTGKTYSTDTGLTVLTQYYFKVTVDGGAETEYDITLAASSSYKAVIDLMNAEVSGATFSLESGDLRCTSDANGADSSISLAAGTAGTDLFATLTDFSAFETAVQGTSTLPDEIPERYHDAIAYLTASQLLMETFETQMAGERLAMYRDYVRKFLVDTGNRNTAFATDEPKRLWWRYEPDGRS